MKTVLQSMWKVAREGSIAVAVSVTMLSASFAAAAPAANPNGGASAPGVAVEKTSFSEKILTGVVMATMWTVGAPFPENTSKAGRIARIGAGIGLALVGGIVATAAIMVTAPVWVAAIGVTAGVGIILTGMHFGFGGYLAGSGHDNDAPSSPIVVAPTSPTNLPGNPTAPDTGRPSTAAHPPLRGPHVIPRLPHGPASSPVSSTGSASTNASPASTPGNNVPRTAPTGRLPEIPGSSRGASPRLGVGIHR